MKGINSQSTHVPDMTARCAFCFVTSRRRVGSVGGQSKRRNSEKDFWCETFIVVRQFTRNSRVAFSRTFCFAVKKLPDPDEEAPSPIILEKSKSSGTIVVIAMDTLENESNPAHGEDNQDATIQPVAAVVVIPSEIDTAVPITAPPTTNHHVPPSTDPRIVNAIPAVSAHPTAQATPSPHDVNAIATVAAQVVLGEDIEAASDGVVEEEARAEFLSATLYKPFPNAKLGIIIAPDARGDIRITGLSEQGSVQHSPLRVGDKLLSINGKNCVDMDNGVAGELLRSLAGTITIIVHNEGGSPHMVETMVEKATPSATVGIGVHQTYRGTLNISKVQASGLFAHSLVNVGDRVIAVNHVNCRRMEARTVIQMIRDAPRYVTLLTETQSTAGVVLAATSDLELGEATRMIDDSRLHQQHFCYCIWMIIGSLLIIGAIVLRPFS